MSILSSVSEILYLKKIGIIATHPFKSGVTKVKREKQVIVSLTSFPARINSTHKTIRTLLQQDYLPDRVILWLAKEQFINGENDLPKELIKLKKFGLEIMWYHDIKSYKKLIPSLLLFPKDLIITVDDDWYYKKDMVKILIDNHVRYPNDIICHDVTKIKLDDNRIVSDKSKTKHGEVGYNIKLLGGSGTLFPNYSLDADVLDEEKFMNLAPTNDDIWFWAMAVKNGTQIRLAQNAHGCVCMTDSKMQNDSALGFYNLLNNTYEKTSNKILETYPEILEKLKGN